jgi:hypothetical protein
MCTYEAHPWTGHEVSEEKQMYEYSSTVFNATPRPFYIRETPGIYCIGGPRAGMDGCGKCRPPLRFDHRTVQPAASRYTSYAIPAN